jgi:hypothetical protein
VYLSWIIGFEKVSLIVDFGRKIKEEEIISIPDSVSNQAMQSFLVVYAREILKKTNLLLVVILVSNGIIWIVKS